jgi:peroxiredoxin
MRLNLLVVLAVALIASVGCDNKSESKEKGTDGTFAGLPDVTLPDVNGNMVSLSDFEGKVVILDFWATWCGPCIAEIPHFKELYSTYHDQGLEIVGVSVDANAEEVVPPFVEEHGITYTILLGNPGLQRKYNLRGLPTTYIIDQKGRVVEKFLGYRDKEAFERLIRPLLTSS